MIESAAETEENRMPPSKWQAMAAEIRAQIASGAWGPGHRLPSTTQLCTQYGVSAQVVRNVMIALKAEGLVEGTPGVGVFVVDRTPPATD